MVSLSTLHTGTWVPVQIEWYLTDVRSRDLACWKSSAPFSAYRDGLTVEQASQRADFCCTLVDGQVKLKKDHAYYYQVQGQLAITGARWCDFFIWIGTSVHLERVYADE